MTHPEPDYGAYFFYSGLRQLGVEVVEYPYQPIYHGKAHRFNMPWYGDAASNNGFCVPPSFYRSWDGEEVSEEDVFKQLRSFDLVLAESPRAIPEQSLKKIFSRVGSTPIFLLDSEDAISFWSDLMETYGVELCFKREAEFQREGVVPFPFSNYTIDDERFQFDDAEKKLDLFFLAGLTHPFRAYLLKELKRIAKKHRLNAVLGLDREPPIGKDGKLPDGVTFRFQGKGIRYNHVDYLKATAQSKIAISARGWGRDTLRFWEIAGYHTLLMSDNLREDWGLLHPYPYTHRENIVFFRKDLSDLEDLIVYYLDNEGEREKVIKNQFTWTKEYHTNLARAKQFLENVKGWI